MLLNDVVGPLRDKDKYKAYGLTIPNGILFYGPPGCGKTYIARQLANELGYNFIEVIPSTFASTFIHDTVLKVAAAFEDAARRSPTMLFVDEFEALVPSRDSLTGPEQYKAEEVNEWLTQISGCADKDILFVAATNAPWKIDIAARRSGRIDKKVFIGPPSGEAILDMLNVHLSGRPVSGELDLEQFSKSIDGVGFSASDLKLIVDEAARLAMLGQCQISLEQLLNVVETRVFPSISEEMQSSYANFA